MPATAVAPTAPTTTTTTTTTTSSSSSSSNMLTDLDDDALAEVVRAAKSAGALVPLATTSKQLCNLSRSRVPVQLRVFEEAEATMVLQSLAAGRPLSSCCTALCADCDLAPRYLSTGPWTALQKLELVESEFYDDELPTGPTCDHSHCATLSLPALQNLRVLDLVGNEYRPGGCSGCSAQHIGQLGHLTRLSLDAPSWHCPDAEDLTALSRLTNLRELLVLTPPEVQPAAGPEGPFALPTSLTRLVFGNGNFIGCWWTHLPGARQLQELEVKYSWQQHPSAHPSALLPVLAQHNQQLRTIRFSDTERIEWGDYLRELPDAAEPAEWRPTADLAALTGLERLWLEETWLDIRSAADWQHLVQLSALTYLSNTRIYSPPDLPPGASFSLQKLEGWEVRLSGYDLGRLLLACPRLRFAQVRLRSASPLVLPPPGAPRLPPHTRLKRLHIRGCWEARDVQDDEYAGVGGLAEDDEGAVASDDGSSSSTLCRAGTGAQRVVRPAGVELACGLYRSGKRTSA